MAVVVGQVVGRSNHSNIKTIDGDSLADAGVKNWVLGLWISSDENEKISLINTSDARIHEVLRTEIALKLSLVASHINILAVKTVK